LFRPVNEEEKLRNVNKIPYEELREPFRKQVENLISKIYRNLKAKSINGQTLTGAMFGQMVSEYVECINNNGMPEINTAWDRVMDTEIKKVLQQSITKVNYELQELVVQKIPMNPKELLTIERSVRKSSFKLIYDPNIKNVPRDKLMKLQQDFMSGIDEIFEGLCKENQNKARSEAKDLLPRMYGKIKHKLSEQGYSTIQDFNEDFGKMTVAYLSNTKEPESFKTLQQFIINNVLEDLDYIMKHETDKMEVANIEMQQKIISDGERIEQLTEMVAKERSKIKEKEVQLREKNQNIRMDMETEMHTMQTTLKNKEDQFAKMQTLIETGMQNNEMLIREIKEKELDSIKTKISADFEKKAYRLEKDYKDKLNKNKTEIKKIFEVTMLNMKTTYDDEIKVLKSKIKEYDNRLSLFKKMCLKKDGEIEMLNDRLRGSEREQKIKMEHADILLKLAGALEEGSTKMDSSTEGNTKY